MPEPRLAPLLDELQTQRGWPERPSRWASDYSIPAVGGPALRPCDACGEPGTRLLPTGEWSCDEHLPDDGELDEEPSECRICTASSDDTDPVVIGADGLCDDCRANAEDD